MGKYISIANKIDGRVIDFYYQKASGIKDQLKLVTNLDTEDYIKKDVKFNCEEKNGKKIKHRDSLFKRHTNLLRPLDCYIVGSSRPFFEVN
ncbi:hypothetical protein HCJ66_05690 [Listeria sp. FSL L7-1582]|uniref:hypothetical protein n=1 Tax=Listeria portnoyi TaxID=2713504 RepID=UPI00164EC3A7|nr:hypothetical protein [Listeria portnoyi]MBC6309042.1 hypothetical protein [Listeria portnoyi]